jgi:predicted enzyme related to lactoylglutathione lyase
MPADVPVHERAYGLRRPGVEPADRRTLPRARMRIERREKRVEVLAGRILLRPTNPERSLAFYRDVLGLAIYREFPGGTVFFLGSGFLELSGRAEEPAGEAVALWLQVRDLATAHRTLVERGATVVRGPRREPWGLDEMWIADPDGTRIAVVEVPPEHPLRRDDREE